MHSFRWANLLTAIAFNKLSRRIDRRRSFTLQPNGSVVFDPPNCYRR